jgi:hypothetical protein
METALTNWIENTKHSDAANVLRDKRNEIKACPLCNHNIEDRKIAVYEELVVQLYRIYRWCGENRRHEFKMSDLRQFLDHNGYARFNDLIQCSNGILYRPDKDRKRGNYGMHMARAKEFFAGIRPIHLQISINQITGEWVILREATVDEIPSLNEILTKEGMYDYERLL